MKKGTFLSAFAAVFVVSAHGQGFLNLNFETAQNLPGNPPIPDGVDVAASNALPGWTAYDVGVILSEINYVSNFFGGAATSVELEGGSLALNGDFSVGLTSHSSIGQIGLVPIDAESLQFDASSSLSLEVTLGGQNLSYSVLSEGPDYSVYGANIPTGLDGQMEALVFDVQGPGQTLLDNIEFSPTDVPEPSECVLVGLGAILFAVQRRRKRQAKCVSLMHLVRIVAERRRKVARHGVSGSGSKAACPEGTMEVRLNRSAVPSGRGGYWGR